MRFVKATFLPGKVMQSVILCLRELRAPRFSLFVYRESNFAFEEIVQMQEMKYFIYMLEVLHTENKIHLKIREERVKHQTSLSVLWMYMDQHQPPFLPPPVHPRVDFFPRR